MLTEEQKAIRKIRNKTKKSMESLGVWRAEFMPAVEAYARMRYQYDVLYLHWQESGATMVEEYTNKAGATNLRKTAEYQVMEMLRKDILNHENALGLTPIGLKRIQQNALKKKKGGGMSAQILDLEK